MILRIRRPDDMHVHLRGGDVLKRVTPYTAMQFSRALVMPNVPPIETVDQMRKSRSAILDASATLTPLMTMKLTVNTTPEMVEEAANEGVTAFKVYPDGVTTGSAHGIIVDQLLDMGDVFDAMSRHGIMLCWHGEMPGPGWLTAEPRMLPVISEVVCGHPNLKQVLEHISTAEAVSWVLDMPDTVAATITVHHLYLTIDDLGGRGTWGRGGMLRPHYFYSPIAKFDDDRNALLATATSGNPKFFLGTDSAPHPIGAKFNQNNGCCAAGVFSAPVAMQALAHRFEQAGALDKLENFTSVFGARFYGLPLNDGELNLERIPFTVPDHIGDFVPFLAGETLNWSLA